jgi:restriction system protein
MARRRSDGLFEDLVRLPWPASLGFGLFFFFIFKWGLGWCFASAEGTTSQAIAKVVQSGALAPLGWVFLGLGCVAAGISAMRSQGRAKLLDEQDSLESIRKLSWDRFERLVGEAYRRMGYRIEETGQGGADGGIDLLLTKDGAKTLVQCKHWRSRQVGVSVVREMFGLMHHHRANAVKIVCTGVFSSDCYRFAVGKPLELVDGSDLARLIGDVRKQPAESPRTEPAIEPPVVLSAPTCPRCSSEMVKRTKRTSGQPFWGCSQYPRCTHTLAI